jgi:SAM-dependent methyltransferase
MSSVKRWLKDIFYYTGNARLLDRAIYSWSKFTHSAMNNRYKKNHPGIPLPPAYFLYETYMSDYERYMEDGRIAAQEITDWTLPYLPINPLMVMEWGCGVARIVRHLPAILPEDAGIFACDINEKMIKWDSENIKGIEFSRTGHLPPTSYSPGQFNIVYAISVFTHIDGREHLPWILEMHRILIPGGIFLFTTHGKNYYQQLAAKELKQLDKEGYFTRSYPDKGHRMMTTYNEAGQFKIMVSAYFDVLEFHDGQVDHGKTGGQDLWILRKK